MRLSDDGNIFGSCDRILREPAFTGYEKKVRRMIRLVDAGGKRDYQYRVRSLVPVASIMRDDYYRAPPFLRGVGGQLDEPYLAANGHPF
jgi:hypothetical protein